MILSFPLSLFPSSLFPSFPLSLFPSFPLSLFPSFPSFLFHLLTSPILSYPILSPYFDLLPTYIYITRVEKKLSRSKTTKIVRTGK